MLLIHSLGILNRNFGGRMGYRQLGRSERHGEVMYRICRIPGRGMLPTQLCHEKPDG